ncbi:hypothetical protein COCNU_04G005700 [Cocos nucifera]|uniref:calcium/calmodulin-dependent protein kinase n=1 Tax=Cocos nucifera TaxID=13894 RepID=A0A8K0I699_COCNU|nr:hypothetical protein COCNU_04G005700 [Cocos nucifera]
MVLPSDAEAAVESKFGKNQRLSTLFIVLLYSLFGMLSYLAFGDDTCNIITTNVGIGLVTILVQFELCINLFFTFSMMINPMYEILAVQVCVAFVHHLGYMSRYESRKLSDDYEVADILGRGGFSIVRRGVRKSSDEKNVVAIKTLRRLGFMPPGMQRNQGEQKGLASLGLPAWKQVSISDALLTNEILVMKRIVEKVSPHPNVINLYDVYEDANGVHLVLELCSGGELFDRIVSHDRYSEFEAAAVVRQIAEGLSALHKANIVHRDLKPENCLFLDSGPNSGLKIMDFGLSSVEDFTDPIVALFGSIDYVSPEALSRHQVTAASDMWSLGVILYILLSGCPPFHAPTNREKQQRILAGDFNFEDQTWKTISSSAKDLISRLLAVEPYKRPTADELLKHPWVIGDSAKQDLMDAEVVSKLQSFNARRKLRAAAIASVLSSRVMLRTKKLKSLLGSHDLTPEELENLRAHFGRM